MRFLQIEWHSHERARNAWDIERAEMKAKIAKQEGELRHAKLRYEQLDRQVRMLEAALKSERAKSKAANTNGLGAEAQTTETNAQKDARPKTKTLGKDDESKNDERPKNRAQPNIHACASSLWHTNSCVEPHNSFLDVSEPKNPHGNPEDHFDKTAQHLKRCMQEIQYLLIPPQNLPPAHMLPNGNFVGMNEQPLSPEEMYSRHPQRNFRQAPGQLYAQPLPNHQPPPVPNSLPQSSAPVEEPRNMRYPDYAKLSQAPPENLQSAPQHIPAPYEEPVEVVTHTFDNRGRPINEPELQQQQRSTRQQADNDGWTFDEEPPVHLESQATEHQSTRRPDTDLFPSAANSNHLPAKSPPRTGPQSHRRKSSGSQAMARRRSSQGKAESHDSADVAMGHDPSQFKVKFALRGHLDVVRSVIFSGGGSPSEPEVCTAGDDGTIKRWIVPATYQNFNPGNNNPDLDIQAYFTHRGHEGIVTSLAACPVGTGFSTGGRANGDGWIFSGGQDATVRVWERGRVDPKATLEGHTDAVWAVCVLPSSVGLVFGPQSSNFGGPDRLILVSGSADGSVKVWAVSAPPQASSPSTGSRRGVGGSRRHSVTSGSNFPSSPQPSVASTTPFSFTLVHSIERPGSSKASPTSICPLSPSGENFVVSYSDSSVLVFDTRTGEEIIGMASNETYDGTMNTSINAVVATSSSLEGAGSGGLERGLDGDDVGVGATGSREGVEGVVITGHEDRFVRFFDANSGMSYPTSSVCDPLY